MTRGTPVSVFEVEKEDEEMNTPVTVRFMRMDDGAPIPTSARPGDAAVDLASMEEVTLMPRERTVVGTGLAVEIPPGYAGFVFARSSLGFRCGVSLINGVGVIDSGYRGEIRAALINHSDQPIGFCRGDRIAQLVIQRVPEVEFAEVWELAPSVRGAGGYGSTGR